ncbi:hypothetical protein B7463_g10581, partial [Scytalidium lignicola]
MSPECNDYTWAYWNSFISEQPLLDVALRTQLNDMTTQVNAVIKAAAVELERMGVIFVDGLQDMYNGHRYCEAGANKEQTEYSRPTSSTPPNSCWTLSSLARAWWCRRRPTAPPRGTPLDTGTSPYNELEPPLPIPGPLVWLGSDYTSLKVIWNPNEVNAVGYRLYLNGAIAYSITAAIAINVMTTVTLGGLSPDTTYDIALTALSGDGTESGTGNIVSAATLSLPHAGQTVSSTSVSASNTSTTYEAVILVPYSYTRIFIWNSDQGCDWGTDPGWPINYNKWCNVCNHYMVEGETLFRYTGNITDPTMDAPWSWSPIGDVVVTQDGYNYTWIVPIGMSTTDTSQYVVQVQGYGPFGSVFQPCPACDSLGGPDGVSSGRYCI